MTARVVTIVNIMREAWSILSSLALVVFSNSLAFSGEQSFLLALSHCNFKKSTKPYSVTTKTT